MLLPHFDGFRPLRHVANRYVGDAEYGAFFLDRPTVTDQALCIAFEIDEFKKAERRQEANLAIFHSDSIGLHPFEGRADGCLPQPAPGTAFEAGPTPGPGRAAVVLRRRSPPGAW